MGKNDVTNSHEFAASDSISQELINLTWEALNTVYDPELGTDIVSLGLVYNIKNENGTVKIEMTLTTPGCPAAENLPSMARFAALEAVGDKAKVEIQVVWDPPWNPTMMN
jgi:metal-sulfur cluster biosynthetic enzyme